MPQHTLQAPSPTFVNAQIWLSWMESPSEDFRHFSVETTFKLIICSRCAMLPPAYEKALSLWSVNLAKRIDEKIS